MGTTLLCYQDSESYLHSKSLAEVYHLQVLSGSRGKNPGSSPGAGRQRRGKAAYVLCQDLGFSRRNFPCLCIKQINRTLVCAC